MQEQFSDHDSEDSNRESASANDYPDEDVDIGDDSDIECFRGGDDSSDSDEYGCQNRRKRNRKGRQCDSSSDIDEEEAARRYNAKHGGLGRSQAWLDRLQRKQKQGATDGQTIKEMLSSQLRDGYAAYGGDYDSEEDRYKMQIDDEDDEE